MTYTIDNYSPDTDAVVISVLNSNGNTILVSISRVMSGETHISVVQNGGATIERGILGRDFHIENPLSE